MASKKRAKRETIRGMGNDPLSLDRMRWGAIGPAAEADERNDPEPMLPEARAGAAPACAEANGQGG
ncbi:MAG: hypothetical protein ACM3II_13250 [Rhodospirillaceae bacterium]